MRLLQATLLLQCSLAVLCAATAWAQTTFETEPVIATDEGGLTGYQHSFERTRFTVGGEDASNERLRNDLGFAKVIGSNGVFATDVRTGLVIATMSDTSDKDGDRSDMVATPGFLDYEAQNAQVLDYFVGAGIPRDQIGGVHANTYLSSSGDIDDPASLRVKVDGYASILDRVVDGDIPVADSVAWARLDAGNDVMTEWVYWPAIPGAAIADARRLKALVSGNAREEFFAKLPEGLSEGIVVVHHTPGTEQRPFEALATYDVMVTVEVPSDFAAGASGDMTPIPLRTVIIRHFDFDGKERLVPSERLGAPNTGVDTK